MDKLTVRQQEILDFIKHHLQETGSPPTRTEIAEAFGFRSPNAAEDHLKALERKGAVELFRGSSRGIRLNGPCDNGIPLVGRVAAGSPILAEQNIEDYIQTTMSLFSPGADYFLKVTGVSMIKAGIFDGDLLAVHKTHEVRNGQIIVARIGEEVTVKRLHKQRNKITLLPENDDYEPILVDPKHHDFAIEGLAVGVIRRGEL